MVLLDRLLGLFSRDLGIDLGTANTLLAVRGEGVIMTEPSVVAVVKGTNQVRAIGLEAKAMLGKTPGNLAAIRPLKDGVIADFSITQAMLLYFIRKAHKRRRWLRPRVIIAIPSGITAVERRAVTDSAERSGAREVGLVEEPLAAAIGVGLPLADPIGTMIVDVGGGTTEVAVISLGGIVTSKSLRVAGDEMDEAIVEHMKRNYNLLIGPQRAEMIKVQLGSAAPLDQELEMEVKGRDLIAGLPRSATITSDEIREALREPVVAVVEAIKETLEHTPPELAGDIYDRGVTLAGGGAMLRGLDKVISHDTGLPVRLADDPLTAVARGTCVFLEDPRLLELVLDQSRDDQAG